ncbi:unnamed protein product [Pedinophyceae sp. YPF-701]|nr:unnamed protein product [Pedinophyceae sp. YPF-701]
MSLKLASLARRAANGLLGPARGQQARTMAGAAQSEYAVTYKGVTMYLPPAKDVFIADAMGIMLWSWILVMLYEKGMHHYGPNHWDHYGLDMETDQLYHVSEVDEKRELEEAKYRDGALGPAYREGLLAGVQRNYYAFKSLGNPFKGWVNKPGHEKESKPEVYEARK